MNKWMKYGLVGIVGVVSISPALADEAIPGGSDTVAKVVLDIEDAFGGSKLKDRMLPAATLSEVVVVKGLATQRILEEIKC